MSSVPGSLFLSSQTRSVPREPALPAGLPMPSRAEPALGGRDRGASVRDDLIGGDLAVCEHRDDGFRRQHVGAH